VDVLPHRRVSLGEKSGLVLLDDRGDEDVVSATGLATVQVTRSGSWCQQRRGTMQASGLADTS
jgi:hypothetical protein